MFRTAFAASDKFLQATPEFPTAGPGGLNPFELLGAALDKCSADTALRDINDLLARDVLRRLEGGGRSTAYELCAK